MRRFVFVLFLAWACALGAAAEEEYVLLLEGVPAHGLAMAHVDLTPMTGDSRPAGAGLEATLLPGGEAVPAQFVPDALGEGLVGTAILKLPAGGDARVRLAIVPQEAPKPLTQALTCRNEHFAITFAPDKMAGLPSAFEFTASGKRFDHFQWNDRVYERQRGGFYPRCDGEGTSAIVSAGPLCTVVRVKARYCRTDGSPAPAKPEAVYDWYVFKEEPLLFVNVAARQDTAQFWHELHLLELNFPGEDFLDWVGGEPREHGEFTGSGDVAVCESWGALVDGCDALGVFGSEVRFYDGRGGYGAYMHATWRDWQTVEAAMSAWVWVGSADDPGAAVHAAQEASGSRIRALLTRPDLHQRITGARSPGAEVRDIAARDRLWLAELAYRLEAQGDLELAEALLDGGLPENWTRYTAGELGILLEKGAEGIRVQSLFDCGRAYELLGGEALPLFTLTLRSEEDEALLSADAGWQEVRIESSATGFSLVFEQPLDKRLSGTRVRLEAEADAEESALHWSFSMDHAGSPWSVWRVAFPQLAISALGGNATALFPRGPGEANTNAWEERFKYHGHYPCGWCSMQFMAAYDTSAQTGLYCAIHDPLGSTKDFDLDGLPATESVSMTFSSYPPDMGRPGNGFTLNGTAVWQLLRGDWFDAAQIYKKWVKAEAEWWPELTANGRADTPLWTRELSAWAQTGGAPGECAEGVKKMAAFLDVPIGFHWYNWHQIPFDNDYPHYFPTKEGFAEAVADLQANHVYVMPYINGRLWDTRDKGVEDFEFSSKAKPAVTKDVHGEPYTEMYGSKEADGSRVKLGVMCPWTALWQDIVKDTVLRIQNEQGCAGVYIDQIAAAAPKLCMDPSHGHPLGGGAWWNQGYWKMLDAIQSSMADGKMITSECNAEPFAKGLDAWLTWHWQHDGQVPAFPAIYGGVCQMFGRAYRGGETQELAMRMKAAQQLVFGEQIGWLAPGAVLDTKSGEFFRDTVQLRWRFRRYFYAGEMARPPRLPDDLPCVRADWQWSGEWWVETGAVLAGAWSLPAEKKAVLLFANVSDEPVTTRVAWDGRECGLQRASLQARVYKGKEGDAEEAFSLTSPFERTLTLAPRAVLAWELTEQ